MNFAQPQYLWAFLLLPALLFFVIWARRRQQAALARLGDLALIQRLSASVNWRGRRWRTRLWFLALILIIIALSRPQWGSQIQIVPQEGIQVMVALDVSQSMLAEDLKPNRLARAKQEIADLMTRLNGDEVGLVLFSGASFIQFPLTSDYDTARAFLDNAQPGIISRPGTVIGEAIDTAMGGFDSPRNNQKVILIMTDGEDHETDPITNAQKAADEGVIIYTIGFGSSQGEPIPEYNSQGAMSGYKKDPQGNVILSKLDEVILQEIAQTTNGSYFRAQPSGSELDALAAELDTLQTAQLESRFETQKVERYQLFLLPAIIALLISELIPKGIRNSH